jgi:hypothetical protein
MCHALSHLLQSKVQVSSEQLEVVGTTGFGTAFAVERIVVGGRASTDTLPGIEGSTKTGREYGGRRGDTKKGEKGAESQGERGHVREVKKRMITEIRVCTGGRLSDWS